MRSTPSSWTKTLTQLGFARKRRRRVKPPAFGRRSTVESLESRLMLSGNVTTLDDVVSANDGVLSLREALVTGGAVTFDASLVGGTIRLNGTALAVDASTTVTGPGADRLTIDAGNASRVFTISGGGSSLLNVTISGLMVSGGKLSGSTSGAGIYSEENLTLNSVVVKDNVGAISGGGLYHNAGSLAIVDSLFVGNSAMYGGGAMAVTTGAVTINASTFATNRAVISAGFGGSGTGAGLWLQDMTPGSPAQVWNSTISSNVAELHAGAGVVQTGHATITNSTFTLNEARGTESWVHSGLVPNLGTVSLNNSIVADNVGGPDLATAGVTGTNSLVDSSVGTLSGSGNIVLLASETAQLAPLGNYGGKTPTHVPLPGSRAIDAASTTAAGGLSVDQRGFSRSADRPSGTSPIDIGAAELSQDLAGAIGGSNGLDFNGDGRQDQILFDPVTGLLTGVEGAAVVGGRVLSVLGLAPMQTTIAGIMHAAGDYNGDGRDDLFLMIPSVGAYWGISDGSAVFFKAANFGTTPVFNSSTMYAGDFDGDGLEEIASWSQTLSQWQVIHFDEATGTTSVTNGGTGLIGAVTGLFVGDANRDGRDDLIRRNSSASWSVSLSATTGRASFKPRRTGAAGLRSVLLAARLRSTSHWIGFLRSLGGSSTTWKWSCTPVL